MVRGCLVFGSVGKNLLEAGVYLFEAGENLALLVDKHLGIVVLHDGTEQSGADAVDARIYGAGDEASVAIDQTAVAIDTIAVELVVGGVRITRLARLQIGIVRLIRDGFDIVDDTV